MNAPAIRPCMDDIRAAVRYPFASHPNVARSVEAIVADAIRAAAAKAGHKARLPADANQKQDAAWARRKWFLQLYASGMDRREVAQAMGLNVTRVSQIAHDCGMDFRVRRLADD